MSSNQKPKKKNKELSFIKKCILLANINSDKDKLLLNSFDFMPIVKLYTADQKQETFNYTKIKGALLIMKDKQNKSIFYFRIYDYKDYSLRFNLEINSDTKKNYMEIQSNFYCFVLKIGCIGFLFPSNEDAQKIKKIFDEGVPSKDTLDKQTEYQIFVTKNNKDIYTKELGRMTKTMEKKYESMVFGEKSGKHVYKRREYLIFSGFIEIFQLLKNTAYDQEDNLFNIFIDKNYSMKLFKKLFYNYDVNKLYPFRLITRDYVSIYNKANYIELLVGHLMNNFKEEIEIYKKRRENDVKEKNKILNKNAHERQYHKKSTAPIKNKILEENEEENNNAKLARPTSNTFGKFISGLNPFK